MAVDAMQSQAPCDHLVCWSGHIRAMEGAECVGLLVMSNHDAKHGQHDTLVVVIGGGHRWAKRHGAEYSSHICIMACYPRVEQRLCMQALGAHAVDHAHFFRRLTWNAQDAAH